jgi:hypothetical protein
MARVTVEVQKSVRIRSLYRTHTGDERVSRSKAYTSPHNAAKAYAQSSTYAWISRKGYVGSIALAERERKVYDKVRPYFDRLFAS